MKARNWIIIYACSILICLIVIPLGNISVDPYMHYRKPKTDKFYYTLDNARSMNNGIVKHFDYDAIILGTSMTQNYKASEFDSLFSVNSVKVPSSGASYKESCDLTSVALKYNPKLKLILWNIDIGYLLEPSNMMRTDLGSFPEYLYDDDIYNDYQYWFSRDVFLNRVVKMKIGALKGRTGITSFDDYSNWSNDVSFGVTKLYKDLDADLSASGNPQHLSEEENILVTENVRQNLTSLPTAYPNVTFYYCISPYSAAWWQEKNESGEIYKYIEAQRIAFEEILKCKNIKLYSFFNMIDMTSDLNNYKDKTHYGEWINSLLLQWMAEGRGQLTADNFEEYLDTQLELYRNFDYPSLLEQIDYEDDYLAASVTY